MYSFIILISEDTVDEGNPASPTGWLQPELNNGLLTIYQLVLYWCRTFQRNQATEFRGAAPH